ncbi:MAG: baseplate J/gp47 family protein [Flavobacteriales bacterium]|nr:baseplate J/gp47 family protein [Flavobacteriales bacterium]
MIERRKGTIRDQRSDANLLDTPFRIDQRSFGELMGYMASFLDRVNYYDLQNNLSNDTNWRNFIENDPIIFMVLVVNEPLTDLEQLATTLGETKDLHADNANAVKVLLNWYDKIEQWYEVLMNLNQLRLANKLKNVLVDVLENPRSSLMLYQQKLSQQQGKDASQGMSPFTLPVPPAPSADINLGKIVHTFQKVIMHIQQFTFEYIEQNVYGQNNHMPNNAMYIAFALLFKHVQAQINTLTQRHLDFYYKDVLQQQKRPGSATKAVVSFNLLPNISYSLIDKGAQLSAGKLFGSKNEVVFETEKPLVAYQMELMEMQTLFFHSSAYIQVGTDEPTISSVSKNNLISGGKDVSQTGEWYAFGADKQSIQDTQIHPDDVADIGFILGSSVLFLSEGKREISIRVNMNPESAQNTFWKLLNQVKTNRKIGMDIAVADVFDQSLKIAYTTKKGWVNFDDYSIGYNETDNYFTINLVLENSDPALEMAPADTEQLKWPSIKVELNEYAPVYLYSFWKGLEINTIDIDVHVDRVRNLSIYNNIGKIALGKAFDLFGPFPALGSYLMVGKSEFFKKRMTSLTVHLDWAGLPDDYGGFDTYYNGYPEMIGNDSFVVQVTALSDNFWLPADLNQAPSFNLFSVNPAVTPEGYESVQLSNTTDIAIEEFSEFGSVQDFNLQDPLKYEITSQSGFIKFTLTAPKFGFASELYQKEYVEVATFNAKNKKVQLPYPNKPYIPKVSGISVDYAASDTLIFNEEFSKSALSAENSAEFIHITPFGVEEIITDQNASKNTLVCDYQQEGYLYLGLKGIKNNTTVSVYFDLLQSSTGVNITKGGLNWEYFQVNRWVPFDGGNIIQDNTNGFIKSGIIEFLLPTVEGIGTAGHQMLYWIRISTPQNAAYYPRIKGVYLNAVEAVCMSTDPLVIGQEIPAGSINKLVTKYPDVQKVVQPAISYGGELEEADSRFYAAVSERLRHKGRVVSIWDYERLILQRFNEVRVVKCTNFDQSFKPVPGHVKVVVLSTNWNNEERHYFDRDKLDEMEAFLQQLSSPFVSIRVINPAVEYLLANCVVEFKPEDNGGYYLNLLNQAISDFLSPISSIDNGQGGIGGSVVPTMLMSFLENLPYVETIKKLTIEHIVRNGENDYSLGVFKDGAEIKTTTPWSILSPVNQHHVVSVVSDNQPHNELEVGLGNMEIGLDLILGEKNVDVTISQALALQPVETTRPKHDAILVFKNKL